MYIYKAGIVGAGLMGSGIAQVFTFAGIPVVLKDINRELVDKGIEAIKNFYDGRVKKGKMTPEDAEAKINLVKPSVSYDDFKDVDIVIEVVPEDLELKKRIFAELDSVCPGHTILASNTSSLSISAISSKTKRTDKVVGMHFFYPATVMKLVEVIPGFDTSTDTIDTVIGLCESLRKIPIKVKECAGFLVNRLLMPYVNEAGFALQEGSASAKEIDNAMVEFGMPMGPFALCDALGIDICYHVAGVLYDSYGERAKPAKIISKLFERKMFGQKSGIGFYVYSDKEDKLPEILKEIENEEPQKKSSFSVERLLFPMINEAALCIEEEVSNASDIDIAMMAGTGFPRSKDGLLKYADSVGLDLILEKLIEWEKIYGERFHPAPYLKRLVLAGYLGQKTGRGFHRY